MQYELLLRLKGDDGDLIPAAAFIGVAERFDMVREIDRWVVSRAMDLIRMCEADGAPVRLEVNIFRQIDRRSGAARAG